MKILMMIAMLSVFLIGCNAQESKHNSTSDHTQEESIRDVRFEVKGTPVHIYRSKVKTKGDSGWIVQLENGDFQRFKLNSKQNKVEEIVVNPNQTITKMPNGEHIMVTPPIEYQSSLSKSMLTLVNENQYVFVAQNGDVVFWEGGEIERLAVNALPDTQILVGEEGIVLLLTDSTNRYQHGILGDKTEASAFVLIDSKDKKVIQSVKIPSPDVIESLSPIWVDWDKNGEREVVLTLSNNQSGARLALFKENGDLLAEGDPIGMGNRWRHALTVDAFGKNRTMELAEVTTPHIGGELQFIKWNQENGILKTLARKKGFSTHNIGSRNVNMFATVSLDQNSGSALIIPNQRKDTLIMTMRSGDAVAELAAFLLNGTLSTNIETMTFKTEC